MERFNLRNLNELDVRKHQIETSNKFLTLENLTDSEDIDRAWENIKCNNKISAKKGIGLCKLKQHKQ